LTLLISIASFSHSDTELFQPLVDFLLYDDQYMLLDDCQEQVSQAYRDRDQWMRMVKLSSDRTIWEYCQEIWKVNPVKISLED
jgi:starch phosphorylase